MGMKRRENSLRNESPVPDGVMYGRTPALGQEPRSRETPGTWVEGGTWEPTGDSGCGTSEQVRY